MRGGNDESRERLRHALFSRRGLRVCFCPEKAGEITMSELLQLVKCYDMIVVAVEFPGKTHIIDLDTSCNSETTDSHPCETLFWNPTLGCDEAFWGQLDDLLNRLMLNIPVWACILIGGKSSRMGRPKHLIRDGRGKSWLANTIDACRPLTQGVVISGGGDVPSECENFVFRVPDAPGIVGPMAGIISSGRWQPQVSWLVVACDMPNLSRAAGEWLLSGRRPGLWGRIPRLPGGNKVDPLFAWYDFRALGIFEEMHSQGIRRISRIIERPEIETVSVPAQFADAWINVNTPDELRVFSGS